MEAHAIASLPLQTRNYNQLALLVPGAVTISPASFNTGKKTFNSARPNINGNREQANYYVLDGMDNNEFVDNNVAYSPSIDAIQEFNVITNNPSAEFGHFLGGVINVSLKSGTNQFHGNCSSILRNDFFNANEWSNNFNGLPTPRQRWNEFGGTLGGPVQARTSCSSSPTIRVRASICRPRPARRPPSRRRMSTATCPTSGVALHYPARTCAMPSDLTKAAICGAGQRMGVDPCITGLSPTALKIAAALPKPNLPGTPGSNGTTANLNNMQSAVHARQPGRYQDGLGRRRDQDRVFARYSQQHIEKPIVNSEVFQYSGTGSSIFPLQSAVLGYTRTISSRLVNDFRAGMNYFPAEDKTQALTTTAGAGLIPGQPTQYLPGLSFRQFQARRPAERSVRLRHHVLAGSIPPDRRSRFPIPRSSPRTRTRCDGLPGIRYRNNYIPATSNDGAAGQIGFNGTYTGYSEADFFLGLPSYMGYGLGFAGTVGQRNNAIGAFVQDDWRITQQPDVEFRHPLAALHAHLRSARPHDELRRCTAARSSWRDRTATAAPCTTNTTGSPISCRAWALAYSLDDKTVVRAAFSRSSFQEGTGEYNRLATNAPWNVDLVGHVGRDRTRLARFPRTR